MKFVGCDTETHAIMPGLLAPPLVCVTAAWRMSDGTMDTVLHDAEQGATVFESFLDDPDTTVIFHNAPFDVAVLCEHRSALLPKVFKAYEEGRIRDTKVRQMLKEIAQGRVEKNGKDLVLRDVGGSAVWEVCDYSLANLGRLYLGKNRKAQKEDPNSWRVRFAELAHLSPDLWPAEARDYALEDAVDALEVFEKQHPDGLNGVFPTELEQTQADFALHLMSCWGMRTDPDYVAKLERTIEEAVRENHQALVEAGFFKSVRCASTETPAFFETEEKGKWLSKKEGQAYSCASNERLEWSEERRQYRLTRTVEVPCRWGKDTKAIEAAVEGAYATKGKTAPRTESGKVSTDKDSLYQSGDPLLAKLADQGGLDKIKQTYLPVLKQGTEVPINARFNVLVSSGRTSCKNPNLQNLPTGKRVGGVRETFVARPGHVFVSADYDTLELRSLAQVCLWLFGESRMAEVINDGRDLHSEMGAAVIHVPYEQVEANKKVKGSPEQKARNYGKVIDFGAPGGLGIDSLIDYARAGYGIVLTRDEAKNLLDAWKSQWPEMPRYFRFINTKVGMGNATIEHMATGYVRGAMEYTQACNHFFQHLAAHGAKRAVWRVAKECYVDLGTALYGCRVCNFVHDELIIEAPTDRASEAADRLVDVMVEAMSSVIPDVKITASPAAMERWWKDATEVRDSNGRLLPWSPAPKDLGVVAS